MTSRCLSLQPRARQLVSPRQSERAQAASPDTYTCVQTMYRRTINNLRRTMSVSWQIRRHMAKLKIRRQQQNRIFLTVWRAVLPTNLSSLQATSRSSGPEVRQKTTAIRNAICLVEMSPSVSLYVCDWTCVNHDNDIIRAVIDNQTTTVLAQFTTESLSLYMASYCCRLRLQITSTAENLYTNSCC